MSSEEAKLSPKQFIETLAKMDELVEHRDNCGHCGHQIIMAETARYFIKEERWDISDYVNECRRRWVESKYFKIYQEAQAMGRDPAELLKERGLGEL